MYSFLWMLAALLSFCLMAVGARELSGGLEIYQTLFFRSVIGLLCILVVIRLRKRADLFATKRLRLHTFRNIFHFAGQYGWFLGISLLPLAEVFALEFTVPVWTAIIAAIFLNEKINTSKVVSISLGLLGVLIIVKPGYGIVNQASLIVLVAAICFSVSHAATKSLSASEDPLTILFYMCVVQLPISFFLSTTDWVMPPGIQWFWIVVVGVTALSAHYCMTKAMQTGEVTSIVTLDFLRLPLIALVGILIYNEEFEFSLIFGGLLMLLGNLLNLVKPLALYHKLIKSNFK